MKHSWSILGVVVGALLLTACAMTFNRSVFNAQKASVDLAYGALHGYNLWLGQATNAPGVTATSLTKLLSDRDTVYAATRKFALTQQTVTALRLAYATNSADTNKIALTAALAALNDNSSNIVDLVKAIMGK